MKEFSEKDFAPLHFDVDDIIFQNPLIGYKQGFCEILFQFGPVFSMKP